MPGISIRDADLVRRLKEEPGAVDLDFRKIIEKHAIGGNWQIEFMGRSVRPYSTDDVITFGFSAGGAGYGDSLEADPERVVQDLVDGIISEWSLRNIYKVGYDAETLKVDREETAKLRAEERQARLARGKPWAKFQAEWF